MSVKTFISFTLGALVGAGGCYLYLKNKLQKDFDKKLTNELLKTKKDLSSYTDSREELKKEFEDENDYEEPLVNSIQLQEAAVERINTHMKNYKKIAEEYNKEELEWGSSVDRKPIEKRKLTPYMITEEDHFENEESYDIINCVWHNDEGILKDENGEAIDDVDATVGMNNISFLVKSGIYEIFVRNEYLYTDYEITWE